MHFRAYYIGWSCISEIVEPCESCYDVVMVGAAGGLAH